MRTASRSRPSAPERRPDCGRRLPSFHDKANADAIRVGQGSGPTPSANNRTFSANPRPGPFRGPATRWGCAQRQRNPGHDRLWPLPQRVAPNSIVIGWQTMPTVDRWLEPRGDRRWRGRSVSTAARQWPDSRWPLPQRRNTQTRSGKVPIVEIAELHCILASTQVTGDCRQHRGGCPCRKSADRMGLPMLDLDLLPGLVGGQHAPTSLLEDNSCANASADCAETEHGAGISLLRAIAAGHSAQASAWTEHGLTVQRVAGGANNALYHVHVGGEHFACKLYVDDERRRARPRVRCAAVAASGRSGYSARTALVGRESR